MPDLTRDDDGFTKMQRRFLFYYLRDPEESRAAGDPVTYGNATQSAIEAGYSERTAHSIGHKLKNKPHFKEAIDGRGGRYIKQRPSGIRCAIPQKDGPALMPSGSVVRKVTSWFAEGIHQKSRASQTNQSKAATQQNKNM